MWWLLLLPGWGALSLLPPLGSSPVQDPHFVAASQGCPELVSLVHQGLLLELLPGKVPLPLSTLGNGVAVDGGAQVGVDPSVG